MRAYNYRKMDAFTSDNSLGNPAACIYLEEGNPLSEEEMLSIAKQHKGFVSEVVYCMPMGPSSFGLTYYSSECEVDFCGHGTIACMYRLIKEAPSLMGQKEMTVHTKKKGSLTVYNEIDSRDAVYITAPVPQYVGADIDPDEIAENLSLRREQVGTSYPVDLIDAGLMTLIVPLATLEDEVNAFPNAHNH